MREKGDHKSLHYSSLDFRSARRGIIYQTTTREKRGNHQDILSPDSMDETAD